MQISPIPGPVAEAENELVLSFLAVRRALGFLGLALPLSLLAVAILTPEVMHPSISEFYYGRAGDMFVGILCSIGIFLWTYVGYPPSEKGEWPTDRLISRIAAVAAICVALIPTENKNAVAGTFDATCTVLQCALGPDLSRTTHYISAGVFFACLAFFCLVLFRRTGLGPADAEKQARNKIYALCGFIILGSIAALALYGVIYRMQDEAGKLALDRTSLVFILESIGVFAFAISWLVKGETLKPLQRIIQRESK